MTRIDRISESIAEEAQLLAEEKWIIQALNKLKKQKNCLQIEKLQLESSEAKIRLNYTFAKPNNAYNGPANIKNMQGTSAAIKPSAIISGSTQNSIENPLDDLDDPMKLLNLDTCNDEELDLAVSKSVFSNEFKKNVLEEDEEEDEDDMLIDMNMLMNSKNSFGH